MGKQRQPKKKRQPVNSAATPSFPKLLPAADRGKAPRTGEKEQAPSSPTHWIMRLIWKSRWRGLILTVITVVTLALAAYPTLNWLRQLLPHMHPFPTNPVVISIQPKGEFGDLRAD